MVSDTVERRTGGNRLTDFVCLRFSVAGPLDLPLASFDLVHLELQLLEDVLLDAFLDIYALLV